VIEVCFFEVYLKVFVCAGYCYQLYFVALLACIVYLVSFHLVLPIPFSLSVLGTHWVCLVLDFHHFKGYLKNLFFFYYK